MTASSSLLSFLPRSINLNAFFFSSLPPSLSLNSFFQNSPSPPRPPSGWTLSSPRAAPSRTSTKRRGRCSVSSGEQFRSMRSMGSFLFLRGFFLSTSTCTTKKKTQLLQASPAARSASPRRPARCSCPRRRRCSRKKRPPPPPPSPPPLPLPLLLLLLPSSSPLLLLLPRPLSPPSPSAAG